MIIDDYKMYSDYQWLMSYFQGSPKDQPGRPGFPGQALSRQLLIQQDNGLSGTAAAFCCDKEKFFVDNLRSFDVSICITHYGPLSSTINDTIWQCTNRIQWKYIIHIVSIDSTAHSHTISIGQGPRLLRSPAPHIPWDPVGITKTLQFYANERTQRTLNDTLNGHLMDI